MDLDQERSNKTRNWKSGNSNSTASIYKHGLDEKGSIHKQTNAWTQESKDSGEGRANLRALHKEAGEERFKGEDTKEK